MKKIKENPDYLILNESQRQSQSTSLSLSHTSKPKTLSLIPHLTFNETKSVAKKILPVAKVSNIKTPFRSPQFLNNFAGAPNFKNMKFALWKHVSMKSLAYAKKETEFDVFAHKSNREKEFDKQKRTRLLEFADYMEQTLGKDYNKTIESYNYDKELQKYLDIEKDEAWCDLLANCDNMTEEQLNARIDEYMPKVNSEKPFCPAKVFEFCENSISTRAFSVKPIESMEFTPLTAKQRETNCMEQYNKNIKILNTLQKCFELKNAKNADYKLKHNIGSLKNLLKGTSFEREASEFIKTRFSPSNSKDFLFSKTVFFLILIPK